MRWLGAETVAERVSMPIWQIESALERAWLVHTLHQINWTKPGARETDREAL